MKNNLNLKMEQTLTKIDSKTTITNKAYKNRIEPIKELSMGRRYNGNCKQVICIDTLEIFPSIKELAKRLNVDNGYIGKTIKRNGKYKGCTYRFTDEWNQNKAEITNEFRTPNQKTIVEKGKSTQFDFYRIKHNKITDKKVNGNSHPILCLETFERYPSMTVLSKKIKIDKAEISRYIRDGRSIKGRRYVDLSKTQYHQNDIIESGLKIVEMAKDVIKAVQKAGHNTKTLNLTAETEKTIKRIKDN